MWKLNTKKYTWIIAVVVLLIFLHFTKILVPVESIIVRIFNPVLSSLHSASSYLRITYSEQTDKRDLLNTVKQLEIEVNNLTVENARLKALEEENQILREYLKFSKEGRVSFILGNIIAREGPDSNNLNQDIIIDKGREDGIEVGLGVVSGEGTIIGNVVGVKDNLSKICLITSRNCKLAATIQNIDKTSGIVSGELGLTIKMEFIPQTERVSVGDSIITSGLEENIPRGLVIGKVTEVNKESNELWQSATIEPLVDLDNLIIVSVLLSK
jgi:rod shape-determining protein MreC